MGGEGRWRLSISTIVNIILTRHFHLSDIFPVHKLGLMVGQTGTSNRAGGLEGQDMVGMERGRLVIKSQPSAYL